MNIHNILRQVRSTLRLAVAPLIIVLVTASLGFMFHVRGERVTEQQLREHMLSIVSIAALNIDADLIDQVRRESDMGKVAFRKLVEQLGNIRDLSPHTRFAYIMRRTDDPMTLAFVADADALSGVAELDMNGNGMVDDDEAAALPGDPYPVDDFPTLQNKAFEHPIVEDDIQEDQWGRLLSAYAPIADERGNVVAILGIDIEADEFFSLTQKTFSLVAVALVVFVGALLAAYIVMVLRSRHLDSMRELDTERTALLDLATHQLGMPLATFRWWLELLRERDNGKFCKRGDICDQLQEGIDRMDNIIKGLQQAGKLQASDTSIELNSCSVGTVARGVVRDLSKTYNLRKQKIVLTIPRNLPKAMLDEKLCAGMLRELLENASWYSPKGTAVHVTAAAVRGGIEISIKDRGYGIPAADLPRIFEQFKRGSNATKYKPAGNGLGLYIVQRIVQRSRGRIALVSELGKGTTVTLFLRQAA